MTVKFAHSYHVFWKKQPTAKVAFSAGFTYRRNCRIRADFQQPKLNSILYYINLPVFLKRINEQYFLLQPVSENVEK